ncbi:MAG: cell division protein SepF, partial [Eubacteriaceae bacterium]|nr:cell division protein SepF [Eubacteriaceae bacterium]
YTLNGSIQKIARNVFVLAPSNIDIVSDNENNLYSKDVANWELDD